MSVITNKDRINENNNKINSLIELVKQKALTSNPKQATTEDEMAAMITDKNVGKVVKYLGESGGKYEKDALYIIAEGDGADSGLFARRLNITEGSLSITENGTYDVMDKVSVDVNTPVPEGTLVITENGTHDVSYKASVEVNVAGGGGSGSNKLALAAGAQSTNNLYDITTSDLEGVTKIKQYTFFTAKGLRSIGLPITCTSIGNYAFQDCESLTSAHIPSATNIGINAFTHCTSLTSVSMPNVTSIGMYAFQNCSALTSLTIPSTCTSIGGYALKCGTSTNKCTFTFEGTTPPSIQSDTFNASYINKIIVPVGCGEAYKTATNWTTFADYIEEATE